MVLKFLLLGAMCMGMLLIKFQPRKSKIVELVSICCDHTLSHLPVFYCTCWVDTYDRPGGSSGTVGWVRGLTGSWVRWAKCFR
jgi:hypothetical protein